MATWTTLPDATLEPGKPIRSIDVLALRDNPVAISEGASGAPKILDAALGPTVTTAGTNWVQNRIAGGAVGEVGTYAFLEVTAIVTVAPGATRAGSGLKYSGLYGSVATPVPAGTWRCMGYARSYIFSGDPDAYYYGTTLWLRIA